jgi:hypothetical protein
MSAINVNTNINNTVKNTGKPKGYFSAIPITNKDIIGDIMGVDGDRMKRIAEVAGSNTRIQYDHNKAKFIVTSDKEQSLRVACEKIVEIIKRQSPTKKVVKLEEKVVAKTDQKGENDKVTYVDKIKSAKPIEKKVLVKKTDKQANYKQDKVEEKKSEYMSEEMAIHPDIIKANLVNQMIGSKGVIISEIIQKVGKGSKIAIMETVYKIEAYKEKSIIMLKSLLKKREHEILTNEKNQAKLVKVRGYYLRQADKGKIYIEIVDNKNSIIEIQKKKDNIRYQLSKKQNIDINQVSESDINEEFNNMYKQKEDKENISEEVSKKDDFISLITTPIKPIETVWNNSEILMDILNELPKTTEILNHITAKNHKNMLINKRLEEIESEYQNVNISYLLNEDDDEEEDVYSDENEISDVVNDISFDEFNEEIEEMEALKEDMYHSNLMRAVGACAIDDAWDD